MCFADNIHWEARNMQQVGFVYIVQFEFFFFPSYFKWFSNEIFVVVRTCCYIKKRKRDGKEKLKETTLCRKCMVALYFYMQYT